MIEKRVKSDGPAMSGSLANHEESPIAMISPNGGDPAKSDKPAKGRQSAKSRRLPKLLLLLCAAVAIVLVAASCGGSGAPTGFAAEDGGETVRENFIEGCEVAVADSGNSQDSQLAVNAEMICECTYDRIVRDSATSDGITFEDFDEVDDDLREDIDLLTQPTNDRVISKIREYMRRCITANS